MSNKDESKKKKIGKCLSCKKDVYINQLYVEENEKLYHYSCYNHMKADEDRKVNDVCE